MCTEALDLCGPVGLDYDHLCQGLDCVIAFLCAQIEGSSPSRQIPRSNHPPLQDDGLGVLTSLTRLRELVLDEQDKITAKAGRTGERAAPLSDGTKSDAFASLPPAPQGIRSLAALGALSRIQVLDCPRLKSGPAINRQLPPHLRVFVAQLGV